MTSNWHYEKDWPDRWRQIGTARKIDPIDDVKFPLRQSVLFKLHAKPRRAMLRALEAEGLILILKYMYLQICSLNLRSARLFKWIPGLLMERLCN
jgi:hypothetical protein